MKIKFMLSLSALTLVGALFSTQAQAGWRCQGGVCYQTYQPAVTHYYYYPRQSCGTTYRYYYYPTAPTWGGCGTTVTHTRSPWDPDRSWGTIERIRTSDGRMVDARKVWENGRWVWYHLTGQSGSTPGTLPPPSDSGPGTGSGGATPGGGLMPPGSGDPAPPKDK